MLITIILSFVPGTTILAEGTCHPELPGTSPQHFNSDVRTIGSSLQLHHIVLPLVLRLVALTIIKCLTFSHVY